MDYHEYQKIMNENGYVESDAVRVFLKRAEAFKKRKDIFMLHEDKNGTSELLEAYIRKTELQRIKAVWNAIDCAELEKRQGFKFDVNDGGDEFIKIMEMQYKGDISRMTKIEKLTYKYTKLIKEFNDELLRGELTE